MQTKQTQKSPLSRYSSFSDHLGFSLIELVVVITIIGIISSIGVQSFTSYLESSRDSTRVANLTTISNFLGSYGQVNGYYPTPDGAQTFYYSGTSSPVWSQ